MLGWHWMIDAQDCDPLKLSDRQLLVATLTGVPDALGLTRVGPPQVFEHVDEVNGVTKAGVVLIAESHFSLHLRPVSGVLHADLFSCAKFETGRALALLQERFGFVRFDERMITRGQP